MENPLNLEFTKIHDDIYWAYNVPLQMWSKHKNPDDKKSKIEGWRVLNYMPRRQKCKFMDKTITPEEMPKYCKNAAKLLRNLADRFDKMAKNEIDNIYYHDEI